MTYKFKIFGLAVAVAFAMSGLAASAASAEGAYTAAEYPATLDGVETGENKLVMFGNSFECSENTFSSTLSAASTLLTVQPDYTGCLAAGGALTGTFLPNGCDFAFWLTKVHSPTHGTADMTIICPKEKEITFNYYSPKDVSHNTILCQIHIPEQHLTGVTVTVVSGKLILEGTVKGIKATRNKGAICEAGTAENGEYVLNQTYTGTNEAEEEIGLGIE